MASDGGNETEADEQDEPDWPIEFVVPMQGAGGTDAHVAALARLLAQRSTLKAVLEYDLGPEGADYPWVCVRANWRLGCWVEVHGHDDLTRTVAPDLGRRLAALGFDPPGTWPETPKTHNQRFRQPVLWDHIARIAFTVLHALGLTDDDSLRLEMYEFSDFRFKLPDGTTRTPDPSRLDASQAEMGLA